ALRDDGQGPQPAVVVTGGGGTINAVRISTQDAPFTTTSTSFVTVPGAVVGVPVGPNSSVVITADFTAETACSGGGAVANWCAARIIIGGIEARPAAGSNFAL